MGKSAHVPYSTKNEDDDDDDVMLQCQAAVMDELLGDLQEVSLHVLLLECLSLSVWFSLFLSVCLCVCVAAEG